MGGPHANRATAAVRASARAQGCADGFGLAARVRVDEEAFADLVDRLLVHESYFFRDERQLGFVVDLVADLARRPGRIVAVWSAGCAQGEEAGTVVMLADRRGLRDRVRVLGTDLSRPAVARAESGRHGVRALRAARSHQYVRWFVPTDGGDVEVDARIRARTRFAVHNLLDEAPGQFDVVLCRNLLMYLTPAALGRAADRLADALRPGGWLVTGASDPPLDNPRLVRVSTPAGTAYVAPDHPAAASAAAARLRPLRQRRSGQSAARPPAARPAHRPATAAAGPPPARPSDAAPPDGERDADEIGRLLDRGQGAAARQVLAGALARTPLDAELHRLAAIAHLDARDPERAVRHARAGVYLEPESAVGHRLLGWAQQQLGRGAEAARSYARAARLEAAEDAGS